MEVENVTRINNSHLEQNKRKQNVSTSIKREDLETTKKLEKLIGEMLQRTGKSISPKNINSE